MTKSKPTAFEAGLKLLAYGDKSANELWRRLTGKGYSAEETDDAVARLKEYRYVDDISLARRYIEKHKKKKSKERLLWELISKGVEEEAAEEALKELKDDWH